MVYGITNEDSSPAINSSHERLQSLDNDKALQEDNHANPLKLKTMAGVAGQFDDCDDTPREVDLLMEEHVEDLLDAVECLRGKVEQLQIQCEKLSFEKGCLEERLILQETNSLEKARDYEQEISELRKVNLQLMADVKIHEGTKTIPSWVTTSLDAEKALEDKAQAERQVKTLQITLMEKDKQISSLEWQLMDAESTVSSIQAERDQLAVEMDCMLAHEEEDLANYRGTSPDRAVFSDDEYYQPSPNTHSKHTRRHLSDLTKREDSYIDDLTGFVQKGKHASALSNNDVPSATEAQFLGGLKRTTNFNNINDVDEFADFHQDEGVGDSSSIDFTASFPPSKTKSLVDSSWHSFGSDSDCTATSSKINTSLKNNFDDSNAWALSDSKYQNEEGCFDDAGEDGWVLDADPPLPGGLGNYKDESCRSSSSAYFSDNSTSEVSHDPWAFAPDSIIDVSTGEELKSSLQENKQLSKKEKPSQQEKEIITPINLNKNSCIHPDEIKAAFSEISFERSSSVRSDGAVDSLSKESPKHQRINSEPAAPVERRKSSGDHEVERRKSSGDGHQGLVKLEAYQKWRISGRKGQPPAKLKISQC